MLSLVFLAAIPAHADVPLVVPHQGRVLKKDGTPEAGPLSITFRLYTSASGGSSIWDEVQSLPLTNGYYGAMLGAGAPLSAGLFGGADLYLAIQLPGEQEMSPRLRLGTAGYAVKSAKADTATRAETAAKADTAADTDGKVDAKIATHKSDASAHHARYADAEAVAAVNAVGLDAAKINAGTLDAARLPAGSKPVDVAAVSTSLTTHAASASAHHSATSDNLDLTPKSVTVKGTSVALKSNGLQLGAGASEGLTASQAATLTGGGNSLADGLHTHAGLGSGGGVCYTGWGVSSCASGFTAVHSGTAAYPAMFSFQGSYAVAAGAAICNQAGIPANYSGSYGLGWSNGSGTAGVTNLSCVICCK
jgi:hypothetical protein